MLAYTRWVEEREREREREREEKKRKEKERRNEKVVYITYHAEAYMICVLSLSALQVLDKIIVALLERILDRIWRQMFGRKRLWCWRA